MSKLNGVRPSVPALPPASEPTSLIQGAPTIAVLPGFNGILDEIVVDAIPVSLKTTPFPARTRERFPIIGNNAFQALINRILDELKEKAPDYYEQVLEYLPKAEFSTSILPSIGRSDGLFALNELTPYNVARFCFLHEAAHGVYILQHGDVSENAANDYAAKCVAKIESV